MRDLELFPGHNTRCSNLVGLHTEAAILIVKHMCLLRKDPGQQPNDGPAEEAAICSSIATIEKGIVLFRVAVQVTVDPDMPFILLFYGLHQILHGADLRVEALLRINPLSVQIDASE